MYKIEIDYAPTQANNDVIRDGVFKSHEKIIGERDKPFSIFLRDDSEKILGGIQAYLDTQSVYIDLIWVETNLRKQGYGKKLLEAAEQEGIKNGCIFSTLDTWDFQAEEFYLKNGYGRLGEIKNYWFNHSRIFLRKNLK